MAGWAPIISQTNGEGQKLASAHALVYSRLRYWAFSMFTSPTVDEYIKHKMYALYFGSPILNLRRAGWGNPPL